jgi:hypothetical protein
VSSERRDRFLKLERPRPPGGDRPDPLADDARFEGLPTGAPPPGPPSAPAVPEGSTDRFRPPPERPLETAPPRDGAQPFTRCASCQMDNTVYAPACQNCGAPLDTPEQRAFNERLWAARLAEAEGERRRLAEERAREERLRVEESLAADPADAGETGVPGAAGTGLLSLVPARWRAPLAVAGVGVPLVLLLLGRGPARVAGAVLLGVLLVLFGPALRRRR